MNLFSSLITIFFIIFLGLLCYKKNVFSKAHIEGFEFLLIKILMPAYLFVTTYKHDLSTLLNVRYISSYLISFGFLAIIVASVFMKRIASKEVYIRILASGYVNAAIYTLPIITILLKDPTAAIIGNITQAIVIQPIFIACLSAIEHKERTLSKKIIHIITTPLIIMPMIGIALNYLHVMLPSPIVNAVSQIGSSASGIALFVFGLSLGSIKITRGCLKFDLLSIVFAKNILHPLIALFVAYVMKLEAYWFNSLVIAASAPTAFVVYLISKQFSVESEIVKKAIALSSVISTISLIFIAIIIG